MMKHLNSDLQKKMRFQYLRTGQECQSIVLQIKSELPVCIQDLKAWTVGEVKRVLRVEETIKTGLTSHLFKSKYFYLFIWLYHK
jgi:hypothetical protein